MLLAVEPGTRAPGFALPDSKMQVVDLYDYRGKVVLLELMATTCPHCNAFATILEKVQSQYAGRVQILAVANSRQDNQETVAQYVTAHNINYPVLFDAGQMAYSYVRKTPFDLPQVFLIDGNGMVQRHYEYGPFSREIFEGNGVFAEIDKLLGTAKKK